MTLRGGVVRSVLVALVVTGCGGVPPDEARTRQDFCSWFDRFLEVLEEGDSTPEEVDQATEDLIAAGVSFGIRGDAPGIGEEIDRFAEALDAGDQTAVDAFINNTLRYCEDLLNRV